MVFIETQTVKLVKEKRAKYELNTNKIGSPEDVVSLMREVYDLENDTQEHMVMLSLNNKNKVVAVHKVSTGTLNSAIVHPRDVFQRAVLNNAAAIVLVHNHPSGETSPSKADIEVTERIQQAGELMGINLLDHIIIGEDNNYTSLKELNYF